MFYHITKQMSILIVVTIMAENQMLRPVDISCIKGTYSILSDEFKHCSPIHGAVWSETQLLKKYYKCGNAEDFTVKLINELFHLVGDTFSITKGEHTAAYYFTAETIGKIIGIIELDKKTLSNTNFTSSNFKSQLPQKSQKYATPLFKLILGSLCECGFINDPKITVSYPPYTTHAILLGFLYKLSTSKKDFRSYFEKLQEQIPPDSLFTDDGKKNFEKIADWNSSCFDETQVDPIIKVCSDKSSTPASLGSITQFLTEVEQELLKKTITEDPYEAIVFAEIIKQFYHKALPKVINDTSGGDTYFKNAQNEKIGVGFGDCTETTVRNLCNFVVYNQDEKKFIPAKTENLNPSKELLNFYKGENADATKHTTLDKHEAWSNLVQNIPGVIYAQILSKIDSKEHYETDHYILSDYGRPCYILLTPEDLKKIDAAKISQPEISQTPLGSSNPNSKKYSDTFVKSSRKLMVGAEEYYIVADPDQYITYALWLSLKNIIILLNHLFGLELYKDPLTPFKDEKFCSTYFPILCEKFGWTYSGTTPDINLDTPSFNWKKYKYLSDDSGNNIHINLTNNPKAKWVINISRSHSEIKNVESPTEISEEYRLKLFEAFIKCEDSINLYDLLALYAPKESDYENLELRPMQARYLRIVNEDPLKLNLQKLKDSLSILKNKFVILKTKLEALKLKLV